MDRARDILIGLAAAGPDREDWTEELALACWAEAVGELAARQSRPAVLSGRLLIVEVDSPGWVDELDSRAGSIRRRINARLGRDVVGRIVYRLSRRAKPPDRASSSLGEPNDPMRRRVFQQSRVRG